MREWSPVVIVYVLSSFCFNEKQFMNHAPFLTSPVQSVQLIAVYEIRSDFLSAASATSIYPHSLFGINIRHDPYKHQRDSLISLADELHHNRVSLVRVSSVFYVVP